MSKFINFSKHINNNITTMQDENNTLCVVDCDKDELWQTYLDAFPEGTNEIYRERQEYDCSCCRQFVRKMGAVVGVRLDGTTISVWEINENPEPLPYPFCVVADKMNDYIKLKQIKEVFINDTKNVGIKTNKELVDNEVINWNHFYTTLLPVNVADKHKIPEIVGTLSENRNMLLGVLPHIMSGRLKDALETVKGLINNDSLYLGDQHKETIEFMLRHSVNTKIVTWRQVKNTRLCRFKNTVIGTLVMDLVDGVELDEAVGKYESKVAPENYKRSKSLITPAMIEKAVTELTSLGLYDSIKRRHARVEDLSINDIIWANDDTQGRMKKDDLTELLLPQAKKKAVVHKNVTEISIDDFLTNVVPVTTSINILPQPSNVKNLVSITANAHSISPDDTNQLFKWDNSFAWSYNGNLADSSIKQRVKNAGGNVDAAFRVSLSWFNIDDLDISVIDPDSRHIYFGNKCDILDVDMNAGSAPMRRDAVENLSWVTPRDGNYVIRVNQYSKREHIDVGFMLEVEYKGVVSVFKYDKPVSGTRDCLIILLDNEQITITPHVDLVQEKGIANNEWGVNGVDPIPVNMLMLSPNHWGDSNEGNKHYMFLTDSVKNPDPCRGFYNEYLHESLTKHRKVMEVLADKTKCEYDDKQLSGFGFSSTQRNVLRVDVRGGINGTYEIKF